MEATWHARTAFEVLDRVVARLERADLVGEPATDLARAIARFADLAWLCLPDATGEWTEVRDGGARSRRAGTRPSRCIEFGSVRSLPPEKLVHIEAAALGRCPRWMAAEMREVLVYLDPRSPGAPAVMGLARPLETEVPQLETMLRAWFAIEALRARLRQREEDRRWSRIGRETACVAHDLRHNLTLVGLELDRCAAEAVPESPLSEGVERARAELRGAVETCERSLGKPETRAPCERVRLVDLLREIGRKASGISRAGDRTPVEVRCAEGVEVRTDRVLLGRLLQNLVLNALDASPEGHAVRVDAAAVADGEVSITVLDTGRGMQRAELADLLRFGRSGAGGNGIGTASAEECARALGAVLEVRTGLGRGTEVRFRIRSLAPVG